MPDCKECRAERRNTDVPYIVHEADMARQERTIKRLWIALILCILGLIGMFVYEAQFEEVVTNETYEADTDGGGTAIATRGGSVRYYGEGEIYPND